MRKTIKYVALLGALLLVGILLPSCSDSDEPDGNDYAPNKWITLDSEEGEYVKASRIFSENLWHAMNADPEYKDKNFIFSPLALHINLSMAANGASGQTRKLFTDVLLPGISNPSLDRLNQLYRTLIEEIPQTDVKAQYHLSTSMWYGNGLQLKENYVNTLRDYYSTPAFAYTKKSEQAKNAVNEWFAEATGGEMKEYLQYAPTEDFFFLGSMRFKQGWTFEFDKSKTKQDNFYCQSGKVVRIPMMCQTREDARVYVHSKSLRAILSFGNGGFVLHLIKPDEGCTVDEAVEDMTLGEPYNRNVNLKLPKFSLASNIEFLDLLRSIGLEEALNGNGDYSGATENEFSLWGMNQSSMFELDEKGVAYKAVSSTPGKPGDITAPGPPPEVIDFFLDHPFAFEIYEASSGVKIAMGKICEL